MTSAGDNRPSARAELVRRLSELGPRKRALAMLETVDGRPLVATLPAEDVYSTILDVGLADSTELVQWSTAEQFVTYVDLASWQKDRVDPLEVLHWLRAARGDDDQAFIQKLSSLDIELLELMYKKLARIHDLAENPDVDTEGVTMETPDGKFLVEFLIEGVDEAALRRLTFDLMAHNPFELSRFLEAVRWELPTEIEEAAYQFRQARLQDLGFPPLEEAAKVFAWVDPEKLAPAGGGVGLAAAQGHLDLVSAAFRGLDEVERQNLEAEVRALVNCVLVAEAAEPGDPGAIRQYSEYARDILDLGLEHLTGGRAEQAGGAVRTRPLKEIFQLGFSLTLKLKRQVEKLAKEEGAKFGDTWLALDEEAAALNALLRRRPLKAVKVPGADPVPFRSKKELHEAGELLERVRAQRTVLSALLGSSPGDVVARFGVSLAELTPQRLFGAVVARAEVEGVVDAAPFPELFLTELCTRLFEERGPAVVLREAAGRRALDALRGSLTQAGAELDTMAQRVLQGFLKDFGAAWQKDGRVDAKRVLALPIAGQ
ncbi:MAG: hypothetical protein AMXMBFR34_46760 [Myxococcaceae bacterium]